LSLFAVGDKRPAHSMDKVIFVPIFYPRSVSAADSVMLDVARLLVREGHARWINRCSAIRLLREGFEFRGLSCRLRPDAALSTSPEVQAAVDGYSRRGGCRNDQS
jgi:hypothetical protein